MLVRYFLSRALESSVERNHLCDFGGRHYEKHFCEITLNLDQWFRRRCRLKIFLSRALTVSGAEGLNFCNLVECIIGNIRVKLF